MADLVPMTGVEIFYPTSPDHDMDTHINPLDSKEHSTVIGEADKRVSDIKFRIDNANADSFFAFLEAHRALQVLLTTPNYSPFSNNSYSSIVWISSFGNLKKQLDIKYLLDVRFIFVSVGP